MARVKPIRRRRVNPTAVRIKKLGGHLASEGLPADVQAAFQAEVARLAKSKHAKAALEVKPKKVSAGKGRTRKTIPRGGLISLALAGSKQVGVIPQPVLVTATRKKKKGKSSGKAAAAPVVVVEAAPAAGKSKRTASARKRSAQKGAETRKRNREAAIQAAIAAGAPIPPSRSSGKSRKSKVDATEAHSHSKAHPGAKGSKPRRSRSEAQFARWAVKSASSRARAGARLRAGKLAKRSKKGNTAQGAPSPALAAQIRANRRRRKARKGVARRRNPGLLAKGSMLRNGLMGAGYLLGGAMLGSVTRGLSAAQVAGYSVTQAAAGLGGLALIANALGYIGKSKGRVTSLSDALGNWKIGVGAGLIVSAIPQLRSGLVRLIPESIRKYLPGLQEETLAGLGYDYIDGGVYGVGEYLTSPGEYLTSPGMYVAQNGFGEYVAQDGFGEYVTDPGQAASMSRDALHGLPVSPLVTPAGMVATGGAQSAMVTAAQAGFGSDGVPVTVAQAGLELTPAPAGLGMYVAQSGMGGEEFSAVPMLAGLSGDEVEEIKDAPELSDQELASEGLANLAGGNRAYFKVVFCTPDLGARLGRGGVAVQASKNYPGAVAAAVPRGAVEAQPSNTSAAGDGGSLDSVGRNLKDRLGYGGIFAESVFGPVENLPGASV